MIKGYKILEMIVKDELEDNTLIRTENSNLITSNGNIDVTYINDEECTYDIKLDYYIYTKSDGKFHRCDCMGNLGSIGQTRFINYCNLDRDFEIVENKKEMIKISRGKK